MAKHTREDAEKTRRDRWKGFVDLRIPEGTEWEEIAAELPSGGTYEAIGMLVLANLKVTIQYHSHQDAFVCSLTGKANAGHNRGFTMSSWSDRMERAIAAAWYKHFRLADGKAWNNGKPARRFDI